MGALADADRKEYILKTKSVLRHVDRRSHPGALAIEVGSSLKFLIKYPSHEEVKIFAKSLVAVTELELAATDLQKTDINALLTAKFAVGFMYMGQFKTSYSLSLSNAQAVKGADLMMESYIEKYTGLYASAPAGE